MGTMASEISRRDFLAGSAAASLGLATGMAGPVFADEKPMPMRDLGRTGLKVSLTGLGCHPLGAAELADDLAVTVIRRAFELGINYFDTAWSYGPRHSERRLGVALKGLRDKVLLATKTTQRDRKSAARELEESLERLQTDHVDVWQFHALTHRKDTDRILEEDGALAAGLAAVKAGKVRFLGITGHADPRVFVEALGRRAFDTLLIPLNCIDPHRLSFESIALPVANEKGVGVIAMKVFCSGRLVQQRIVKAEECLRYTYALPISTCIVGCATVAEVELAAHVARNLEPLAAEERKRVLEATKAHSPGLEWYKSG